MDYFFRKYGWSKNAKTQILLVGSRPHLQVDWNVTTKGLPVYLLRRYAVTPARISSQKCVFTTVTDPVWCNRGAPCNLSPAWFLLGGGAKWWNTIQAFFRYWRAVSPRVYWRQLRCHGNPYVGGFWPHKSDTLAQTWWLAKYGRCLKYQILQTVGFWLSCEHSIGLHCIRVWTHHRRITGSPPRPPSTSECFLAS